MKIGIIISQSNSENVWNVLRFANFALKQGDEVEIFLIGEGVEYEKDSSEKFPVLEQTAEFLRSEKAEIFACGTCLKLREQEATYTCPINTMKDLYDLIKECDKVLTF